MNLLKYLLTNNGVEYTEKTFKSRDGTAALGPDPFVGSISQTWSGNSYSKIFFYRMKTQELLYCKCFQGI